MRDYQDSIQEGSLVRRSEKEKLPAPTNDQDSGKDEAKAGLHHSGIGAAVTLNKLNRLGPVVTKSSLLNLQKQHGNLYVQRIVALSMQTEGEADVSPEVEASIERSRGGGQGLDRVVSAKMGQALNADFSSVRVHTGAEANTLNHALHARAFTTGRDIYFRQGEYNPGSSAGRELLAHELTHVAQQNSGLVQSRPDKDAGSGTCPHCSSGVSRSIQAKLSLGSPGGIYEQEADNVARAFSHWEQQPAAPEKGGRSVHRQAAEEEKKEGMMRAKLTDDSVRRQPEEEKKKEEMLRTKPENNGLQRLSAEEEKKEPMS